MNSLSSYLQELRSLPPEKSVEPEFKNQDRQKQDQKIREDQDLRAGAIMTAVVEEGEGKNSPGPGDLVYVHVTIRTEEDDVLYSTRGQDGGNGHALAFVLNGGQRAPRAWEIVLGGMKLKQISAVKVKPSYGYQHPECGMRPPEGVSADETLCFEIQLVQWYPAEQVKALAMSDTTFRRIVRDGTGWESPRPPFEVTFQCKARCPAYDGIQLSGFKFFETDAPLKAQMGSGQLPPGLEVALSSMTHGECSVFVLQASQMTAKAAEEAAGISGQSQAQACLLPDPPARAVQVELELELLGLVQVRDMSGDGSVIKRRLKLGNGEFPVDCPVEDTTVRVHYRARKLVLAEGQTVQDASIGGSTAGDDRAEETADWTFDSRLNSGGMPVEFDTGCGEMPSGLEQAIKLMVPGELASVACRASHAYGGLQRDMSLPPPPPASSGIGQDDAVLFEVELVSFDREGHWQMLPMEDRFGLAERLKAKGNDLFRSKRYKYARARYERLLRMLESTRDYETQDEVQRMDALKLAVTSNLSLCCFHQTEYAQSVFYACKAMEHDPGSVKLLLRRARALSMKGDYEQAEDDLKTCQDLSPDEAAMAEVEAELVANRRRAKAAESKQKQTFKSFFDR